MRGPTVYLERDASGQRLTGLRLIGDQQEERYSVPEGASPVDAIRFGAEWIRERIDAKTGGGIGTLCVDPRGAVCSWLDVPGSDDSVVKAAIRQKPSGVWGEWSTMPALAGSEAVESLVPVGASSLEPLGEKPAKQPSQGLIIKSKADPAHVSRRSAVLAMGDLPVRMMIDALDEMKIEVAQVTSIWHAMTSAWDPSAETKDNSDPLVSNATVDTAIVLVEETGRVQWAWSDEGKLLASGSAIVEPDAFEGNDDACSFGSGRLAMDWLAWTAQLGRSPKRVFCLIDTDHGSAGGGAFGQAIGKIWPNAAVDLVPVEDPITSTFLRLQERTPGGKPRRQIQNDQQISALASRPGRAHRGMYRWIAGAILIGAIGLAVLGFKTRASAEGAARKAADIGTTTNSLILSELGENADPMFATMSLQSELDRLRAEGQNTDFQPVRPVLSAMDDLAFWLANMSDIELSNFTIDQSINVLRLEAANTQAAETQPKLLAQSPVINWGGGEVRQAGGKTTVSVTGFWPDRQEGGGR